MNFLKYIHIIIGLIIPSYVFSQGGQIVLPSQTTSPALTVNVEPGQTPPPQPLVIGVDYFTPPYSMQTGNGEMYGFDISMMVSICKIINRACTFKTMKWSDLLPAVMNNQIDFAATSITITPERAKEIIFSIPYAVSYSRFLTNADTPVSHPFSFSSLSGKRIGIYTGTIYTNKASYMGIINPTIITYSGYQSSGYQEALTALKNKQVDYILLDNAGALYWAANSGGAFKVVGEPYPYGFGMGIAISPQDRNMLPMINRALLQYQNSIDYWQNYRRYLQTF